MAQTFDDTIKKAIKTPIESTNAYLTIEKTGSITATYSKKDALTEDTHALSMSDSNASLRLKGNITLTDKQPGSHNAYGIVMSASMGPLLYACYNATKVTVTHTFSSADDSSVAGIYSSSTNSLGLRMDLLSEQEMAEEKVTAKKNQITITVTASNTSTKAADTTLEAAGVRSTSALTYSGSLAAPIKVTATSKSGSVCAAGLLAEDGNVTVAEGILNTITVSATGAQMAMAQGVTGEKGVQISGDKGLGAKLSVTSKSTSGGSVAVGIYSDKGDVTISTIIKDVAVTSDAASGESEAVGFSAVGSGKTLKIEENIGAKLSATAKQKAGNASASVLDVMGLQIGGDITKDMTATASATQGTAEAFVIQLGDSGSGTISGNLAGNITAKADQKVKVISTKTQHEILGASEENVSYAAGIYGSDYSGSFEIGGNITKNITATATANSGTYSYKEGKVKKSFTAGAQATAIGMQSGGILTVKGTISGAIKATATAKANSAKAYGISSSEQVCLESDITKDITATATGVGGEMAEAAAMYSSSMITIQRTDWGEGEGEEEGEGEGGSSEKAPVIKGNLTATATGTALATAPDGTTVVTVCNASAYGIYSYGVQLGCDSSKTITATATAKGVKNASKELESGTATAAGIRADDTVDYNGRMTGTIKATATSAANDASAYGIYGCNEVALNDSIASMNISAVAGTGCTANAYGIYTEGNLSFAYHQVNQGGKSKIVVNAKDGTAVGVKAGTLQNEFGYTSFFNMDMSVTGKEATCFDLGNVDEFSRIVSFNNSNLVAKSTEKDVIAYAFNSSDASNGYELSFDESSVTGAIALGNGSDTLTVRYESVVTGNIDMGGQDESDGEEGEEGEEEESWNPTGDCLHIAAGAQVKGDVTGAENICFDINNIKGCSKFMWEGTDIGGAEVSLQVNTSSFIDLKNKKTLKFNVMKDTDGDTDWSGKTFNAYTLMGDVSVALECGGEAQTLSYEGVDYELKLSSTKSGKTESMVLTMTKVG